MTRQKSRMMPMSICLFLQSRRVGVTVHLMFSCPPFPGSETQPCSAFQDVYLFSEAPAAGGDAGVRSRFTGGLRCSECLTIWISVDKSLKTESGSHSGVSGSL